MARRVRKQPGKKNTKQGGTKKPTPKQVARHDPELAFITAFPPITLRELAERAGYTREYMEQLSAKHGWMKKREEFLSVIRQKALEQLSDTASSKIVEANKRHIKIGQGSQHLAALGINEVNQRFEKDAVDDVKTGELMRASAQAAKAGVDIERKGLGLADQVMYVQNTREFVAIVMIVLQQHLGSQPDVLENVVHDLTEKLEDAERKAGQAIDTSYMQGDD